VRAYNRETRGEAGGPQQREVNMKAYECPQCRGAGEYAYPGDGLRTTKCAKCKGTGFVDFPPPKPCGPTPEQAAERARDPRESPMVWDSLAESRGIVIGSPGYTRAGHEALGFPRPPGPSRIPSVRCESGKRPYCTCDTCF
jgi:hypothetical protein